MQQTFEEENWKEYAVQVHGLKSTSRTLGFESLGELAEQIEMAAKKQDAEFVRANHASLQKEYERVLSGIAKAIDLCV